MAFDYSQFASELGLSADDRAALDSLFGKYPAAATKIDGFLESQVSARVTPLQAEIAKKQQDLDGQFDTLASIRTGDSAAYDKVLKQYEDTAASMAALKIRASKIATDAGLNPDEVFKDLHTDSVARPPVKDPDTYDPQKVAGVINSGMLIATRASLEAADIADDHFALTGQRLSRMELLDKYQETVKRTGNPNLTIKSVWETAYEIPKIKEAKREEAVQARIKDEVTRATQALRDEMALRTSTSETPHFHTETPIFAALTKDQQTQPVRVSGVPEGVAAAVATYQKNHRAA